jgi:hypothetical protein
MQYEYYVFFHFPCNDGELSRIIWEYFEPNSCFYKWRHHDNHEEDINIINNLPECSNVVFLDLTPNIDTINKLSTNNNYIIIDHHKNAIITLVDNKKNLPNYNILLYVQKSFLSGNPDNNNQSGCVLTWKYFTKEELPSIVYYIGSKDVWDFSNPNTEKYCLGFNEYINNFNENDKICFMNKLLDDNNYDNEFINIGDKLIIEYKKSAIEVFNNYTFDTFNINNNNTSINIVDVKCTNTNIYKYLIEYAQKNFEDIDVLRILHLETENSKTYSLRSIKEHITVDNIARFYGGNGHAKAAGYTIYL